jgi:hypothetical protein
LNRGCQYRSTTILKNEKMKAHLFQVSCIAFSSLLYPGDQLSRQTVNNALPKITRNLPAPPENDLFESDKVLPIILKGRLKDLLNDRTEEPKNYPLTLSYIKTDGSKSEIPVEVKTRGHFRKVKGNCSYPPLLIHFPKTGLHAASIFSEQAKLKLVMPCRGDEYVIREWLVYKIYNLVTPKSFRARLVKVQLADDKNKKLPDPVYGILLEEEKQMAKRNFCIAVEKKLLPKQLNEDAFLSMTVFQYLVGNTDWSVQYLQNIKLIARDSGTAPYPVPYDFDHAGIVSAPYAIPPEELNMLSVRQRRYRGYCVKSQKMFEPVLAHFNRLKKDIYDLYTDCDLLDAKYIKSTRQYLDEFYETINNAKEWKSEFAYPCDPRGTGNVVIKGLKTN